MTSPEPSGIGKRITTFAVFGTMAALFAFYATYWARTLVPMLPELDALAQATRGVMSAGSAFTAILAGWQTIVGEGLVAARALSLLASVAALVLVFRTGLRLTRDSVTAAILTLSFVLFPPIVATFAMATPHALFVLLAFGALELILRGYGHAAPGARLYGGLAGILAGLGVMLVPLGAVLMPLWLVFCTVLSSEKALLSSEKQAVSVALIVNLLSTFLILMLGVPVPAIDATIAMAGRDSVFQVLILPTAMVPVAILLSALAAFSSRVRQSIGIGRIIAVLSAPLVIAAVLLSAVAFGTMMPGQLVTAVGYAFPFIIFTLWPLIVWVRKVMPQVKSLLAWLTFPVVMYSCFWVVLGPVRSEKFPYSHRQVAQPPSTLQRF